MANSSRKSSRSAVARALAPATPRLVSALAALSLALAQLSPHDLNRIQVGQPAPGFTLTNADGKSESLSQYRGKNVVLVFYRGQW